GLFIEDSETVWSGLAESAVQTNLIKSWLYLRVRMLFDPPTTSFVIEATKAQIAEFDFRLSVTRENAVDPVYPVPEEIEV
ncbi:MAG: structural protein, partial [Sphingomicrobium sp.]